MPFEQAVPAASATGVIQDISVVGRIVGQLAAVHTEFGDVVARIPGTLSSTPSTSKSSPSSSRIANGFELKFDLKPALVRERDDRRLARANGGIDLASLKPLRPGSGHSVRRRRFNLLTHQPRQTAVACPLTGTPTRLLPTAGSCDESSWLSRRLCAGDFAPHRLFANIT